MLTDSPLGLSVLTHFLLSKFFKNQRSINSRKRKVVRRCLYRSSPPPFIDEPKILLTQYFLTVLRFKNNIFRIHLAAFATDVVKVPAFRVDIIQVKCRVEPASNRKAVKKQAVRVVLGLSIERTERDSSSDDSTLYITVQTTF